MASTIAAVTTSGGGVVTTADASGNLNLLAGTTTVVALTTAGASVPGTLGVTGVATLGNGAILGTPASGTVTNLTGTASININGTVGATTPAAGSFTTVAATSTIVAGDTIRGGTGYYITRPSDSYALSIARRWDGTTGSPLTGTVGGNMSFGCEEASSSVFIAPANTKIGTFSSTGLAVTGTLSNTTGANFATASGNVGIGTSSPSTFGKLAVYGSGTAPVIGAFLGSNSPTTGATLADISFGARTDGTVTAIIRAIANDNSNGTDGQLTFYTADNTASAAASEKMRLDSSGNLGIGTTSPGAKLDVATSTAGYAAILTNTNGASDSNGLLVKAGTVSTEYNVRFANTGDTSTFMVVKGNGNVGIGTTDTLLFNSVGGTTRLAVCGSSATTDILGNTGASISIINTDTTANNTAGLHFARADTDDTPNYAGASIVAQFPETQVTGQYPKGLLAFLTSTAANNAPSEKMRIDSSGNVGIGTTGPTDKLGVSAANKALNVNEQIVNILSTDAVAADLGGSIGFGGNYTGTSPTVWASISGRKTNATDGQYGGYLAFGTRTTGGNTAERMRIDTSGNVGIGGTSPGNRLYILKSDNTYYLTDFANSFSSGNGYINRMYFSGSAPNNGASIFSAMVDTSSNRCIIYANGGIHNYQANNVNLSDLREKINFAPACEYLSKICAIPVQTFNYIDQNLEEDDGLTLGVVAQDVQAVAPELVSESDWSPEKDGSKMRLSIYQTDLQYALMKSIQELKAIIDTQATRIAALENN